MATRSRMYERGHDCDGEKMPAEPTEEDIGAEIKALESGQFKWIEPGGFVDKTKKRTIELRATLQMLRNSRGLKPVSAFAEGAGRSILCTRRKEANAPVDCNQ